MSHHATDADISAYIAGQFGLIAELPPDQGNAKQATWPPPIFLAYFQWVKISVVV